MFLLLFFSWVCNFVKLFKCTVFKNWNYSFYHNIIIDYEYIILFINNSISFYTFFHDAALIFYMRNWWFFFINIPHTHTHIYIYIYIYIHTDYDIFFIRIMLKRVNCDFVLTLNIQFVRLHKVFRNVLQDNHSDYLGFFFIKKCIYIYIYIYRIEMFCQFDWQLFNRCFQCPQYHFSSFSLTLMTSCSRTWLHSGKQQQNNQVNNSHCHWISMLTIELRLIKFKRLSFTRHLRKSPIHF